ncbi:MAG: AMP-binding protein [Clostridia bacterium]|nr:AMP-binding protein [Clostridia bacterium]
MGDRIIKGCPRVYNEKKFNNLKEIINNSKEVFGNDPAFKFKNSETKEIYTMSYKDYIEEVEALGTALISIGLKDKRIGVIGENRYEWQEAYLSITCGTGIVVPLDKALTEKELLSLIERSEIEAIFYTSKYTEIMEKAQKENIGKIKFFISMDLDEKTGDIYSQKELIKLGKDLIKNGARSFLDAKIDNNAMAVMLFTSGTTSQSKAVMLSHTNLTTNIYDITSIFDIRKGDVLLSFLPLHHVFECTVGFLFAMSVGATIAFCEGIRHIAENLKEYEATVMIAVPVLFENMYKKVWQGIDKKGKTKTVKFAIKLSNFLRFFKIDLRKKLFKDIHANFGGKLRMLVAGGAAFDKEAEKGFTELGVDTYQGYGLSETSPVVAAENPTYYRLGSIGKTFPSLETKIVDPDECGIGELAVKGPTVMLGYYGNEEATKECMIDGWFHTGDLAYIDQEGFIFITGRKKSVIVLKNGKNVFPEETESLINKIPGVKESFVFGKPDEEDENDLKMCVEVVFDRELMKAEYGLEKDEEIKAKIWEKIKEINKTMPKYKYVKELIITEEELIKTTTLKIKRHEEIKKVLK